MRETESEGGRETDREMERKGEDARRSERAKSIHHIWSEKHLYRRTNLMPAIFILWFASPFVIMWCCLLRARYTTPSFSTRFAHIRIPPPPPSPKSAKFNSFSYATKPVGSSSLWRWKPTGWLGAQLIKMYCLERLSAFNLADLVG